MGTWFIFYIMLFMPISLSKQSDYLTGGSYLSVDRLGDVLTSPNGIFSTGFFPIGVNAYSFSVWFNDPNRTVVWMANRNRPVNGKGSRLSLLKSGNLILTDSGLSTVWSSETVSRSPAKLTLESSGNLVLRSTLNGVVLWECFDSPTDTILPEQPLAGGAKLVSSRSRTNFSSGRYKFFFDTDNVLRLGFDDNSELSSVYWPFPWLLTWQAGRSTYNNSKIAVLDSSGNFSSSDGFTFVSADHGPSVTRRRLKLDHDGNVRLYSWKVPEQNWFVTWEAFPNPCRIHGICGSNSLCTYSPDGRKCFCLKGYKMVNLTDWSYGCEPEFKPSCTQNDFRFVKIPNSEYYGYDYGSYYDYSLSDCKKICLNICGCKGFQYSFNSAEGRYKCLPKLLLNNGYQRLGFSGDIYIKLPKTLLSSTAGSGLNCSEKGTSVFLERVYKKEKANESVKFVMWFASGVGVIEAVCSIFVWIFLVRTRRDSSSETRRVYAMTGFRRFSFAELKKATSGFSQEIGRGAGGVVYKGILPESSPRVAAVKRLSEADQGEAEFLAEVNSLGRLNHMNLIEMWGYCAEGKHRLLVYEFMEHGSLSNTLSSTALDWDKRFEIALGTAKGLAYLHEECLEWVLHCDVKPQNILLSSEFQPKVADFGLSKLLKRGEINDPGFFTRVRGTRGYMAPEWVTNQSITSKVDVYSYGIVLLEILTGKSPVFDESGGNKETRGLVMWVKEMVNESNGMLMACIEKVMDSCVEGRYDKAKIEILLSVALKCVEEEKELRPTMRQVVEMLQSS